MHSASTPSQLSSRVVDAPGTLESEERGAAHTAGAVGAAPARGSTRTPQAPAHVGTPEPGVDEGRALPVLELENLYHRWRRTRLPVLDGVNLAVREGELVRIGGRNGAGKTTLLRLAAGIFLPQRGTVRMGMLTPRSIGGRYQRQIGFLSAGDRSLYARMRVERQLDYWARLCYIPPSKRAAVVARGLRQFELEELAGRRVDRLSMGQRQRVRLAMAFMHEPAVVMLDEPRNSLDDDGHRLLGEQVELVRIRGGAVLWCSPRGEDGALDRDRAFTLDEGRLEPVA
jgi:ABC-type multidrug transport system ATPase subunit